MLEVKGITKYFGSKLALNNISFQIPKGKIFGIIGPNGAGKTTALRIILGILAPSDGKVLFEEKEFNQDLMNSTGYLPEERGLYPKSSVINILNYFGQLKGLSFSEAKNNSEYWLNRLQLSDYSKYNIEDLSKGNQQKIQFISAILHKPKILILDEPFSGFDPVNQTIFRDIINELKKESYIILSTHLMDLAESLCETIFMINEGKEIISGTIENLLAANSKDFYDVKIQNSSTDKTEFNNFEIIEKQNNFLTIKIFNKNFAEELTKEFEVEEIIKSKTSLHQLFIDLLEEKK